MHRLRLASIKYFQRLFLVVAFLVFALVLSPYSAHAQSDAYGAGSYGDCDYQECNTVIPPVTMPNGLKVSINLSNGQTIEQSGYTIVITPLDGPPSVSIKSATFSIGGTVIETVLPDSSGTVRWDWDPAAHNGTTVDITVTATDDTTSDYSYTVKLASSDSSGGQSNNSGGSGTDNSSDGGDSSGVNVGTILAAPLEALRVIVPENVKQVFRNLPESTINTFPYYLIIILALIAVVALLQIKRELSASQRIMNAILQEKTMIELKENFVGLASHYLRTPLTLIGAGVDVMESAKAVGGNILSQLKNIVLKIGEHVESSAAGDRSHLTPPENPSLTPTIVRISIALAIVVAALIALTFNLLAFASGRSLPALNLIAQVGAFILVGLTLYQIGRRLVLRRDERKRHDYDLALQRYLQDIQDSFLERTVTELSTDYEEMEKLAASVPLTPTTKPLHEGLARIYSVLYKCTIAKSLKGAHSKQPAILTDAKHAFEYSGEELTAQISDKKLKLSGPEDLALNIREPDLVRYTIQSLIDNAVAYSPEQGTVKLGAQQDGDNVVLSVEDEGMGIPKDKQDLLFQPFSKVEGYEQFNHEGMGFNLFLDKLIATYLGGNIDIKSQEGSGTKVSLRIPSS